MTQEHPERAYLTDVRPITQDTIRFEQRDRPDPQIRRYVDDILDTSTPSEDPTPALIEYVEDVSVS